MKFYNANFIAHARTDILALCEVIDRYKGMLQKVFDGYSNGADAKKLIDIIAENKMNIDLFIDKIMESNGQDGDRAGS